MRRLNWIPVTMLFAGCGEEAGVTDLTLSGKWAVSYIGSATSQFTSVAWSGRLLVAVGIGDSILTSPDGLAWTATPRTDPQPRAQLEHVTWTHDRFIATGSIGYHKGIGSDTILCAYLESADGISWTAKYTLKPIEAIIWTGTQYIGVIGNAMPGSTTAGTTIATSPDGMEWTERFSTKVMLRSLASTGSRFVAAGGFGIATSPDGSIWTETVPQVVGDFESVIWTGSVLVAAGGAQLAISEDGQSWVMKTGVDQIHSVAWDGKVYAAIGGRPASGNLYFSANGNKWIEPDFRLEVPYRSIVWTGKAFVAVGGIFEGRGVIITSL